MQTERDVIIIGAGPAGLALAVSLANLGLRVTVTEKMPMAVLADPPPDGRDIALTHRSVEIMKTLGIWGHLPQPEVACIRSANVAHGSSQHLLQFTPDTRTNTLGFLVSNHLIRRAVFQAATQPMAGRPEIEMLAGSDVTALRCDSRRGEVTLAGGHVLQARMIIAADSRFSDNRRRMGIAAHMHDFGRTVIVCRMSHELDNEGVAHECFQHGHTLAVLPMNHRQCSVVITLSSQEAERLMSLEASAFERLVEDYFEHRLGRMQLAGDRHRYPLVAVYARNFVAERFALIGDAAVGMHPVTAHGYNFGMYGVETLTAAIKAALAAGRDIGSPETLHRYQRIHRRATLPIFLGTNALVKLYTDDRAVAGFARAGLLRMADRMPPLKRWITRQLTDVPIPSTRRGGRLLSALASLQPPR